MPSTEVDDRIEIVWTFEKVEVLEGSAAPTQAYAEKVRDLAENMINAMGELSPSLYCSALTSAASTIACNVPHNSYKELQARAFESAAEFVRSTKIEEPQEAPEPETPEPEAATTDIPTESQHYEGETMGIEVVTCKTSWGDDNRRFRKESDAVWEAIGNLKLTEGLEVLCNVMSNGILGCGATEEHKNDLAQILIMTADFIKKTPVYHGETARE